MRSNNSCVFILSAAGVLLSSAVVAQPPVCDAGGPYTGFVGEGVQFDGTRSFGVPPHVIVLYEWQFGDGATATGPTPTHVYAAPAVYDVILRVTDDQQTQSECTSTAVITLPTAVEVSTWGEVKAFYRE